jgi:hypothetical protein
VQAELDKLRTVARSEWTPETEKKLREELIPAFLAAVEDLHEAAVTLTSFQTTMRQRVVEDVMNSYEGIAFAIAQSRAADNEAFAEASEILRMEATRAQTLEGAARSAALAEAKAEFEAKVGDLPEYKALSYLKEARHEVEARAVDRQREGLMSLVEVTKVAQAKMIKALGTLCAAADVELKVKQLAPPDAEGLNL